METVFGNSLFKCFAAAYYVVAMAVVNILGPGRGPEGIKISPSKDSTPSPSLLSSVILLPGLESPFFIDHSQQVSPHPPKLTSPRLSSNVIMDSTPSRWSYPSAYFQPPSLPSTMTFPSTRLRGRLSILRPPTTCSTDGFWISLSSLGAAKGRGIFPAHWSNILHLWGPQDSGSCLLISPKG